MTEISKTPPQVQHFATERIRLPALAVLGIFGSDSALHALIREKSGVVLRVGVGDAAAGGVVAAIDPQRVIITRPGRDTVLHLAPT